MRRESPASPTTPISLGLTPSPSLNNSNNTTTSSPHTMSPSLTCRTKTSPSMSPLTLPSSPLQPSSLSNPLPRASGSHAIPRNGFAPTAARLWSRAKGWAANQLRTGIGKTYSFYTQYLARVWITEAKVVSVRGNVVCELTWPLRMLYVGLPLRPETIASIARLLMVPGGPAVIQYTWHGRRHIVTLPELPRPTKRPPPPIKSILIEGASSSDISALIAPLDPIDDNTQLRAALSILLRRPIHDGAMVVEKTLCLRSAGPGLTVSTTTRRL